MKKYTIILACLLALPFSLKADFDYVIGGSDYELARLCDMYQAQRNAERAGDYQASQNIQKDIDKYKKRHGIHHFSSNDCELDYREYRDRRYDRSYSRGYDRGYDRGYRDGRSVPLVPLW